MFLLQAYSSAWKNIFTVNARSTRREYWGATLVSFVISALLDVLLTHTGLGLAGHILFLLYAIAIFVPFLTLAIRRLHDTDRAGWWYLLILVPLLGGIALLIFFVLPTSTHSRWEPTPFSSTGVS
jgi:uncharacterized membrane protein YhaH (DUF805 family)